jgi:hypothetical protein
MSSPGGDVDGWGAYDGVKPFGFFDLGGDTGVVGGDTDRLAVRQVQHSFAGCAGADAAAAGVDESFATTGTQPNE